MVIERDFRVVRKGKDATDKVNVAIKLAVQISNAQTRAINFSKKEGDWEDCSELSERGKDIVHGCNEVGFNFIRLRSFCKRVNDWQQKRAVFQTVARAVTNIAPVDRKEDDETFLPVQSAVRDKEVAIAD